MSGGHGAALRAAGARADRKSSASTPANALTIDVEDYFQVEAFASTIDRGDWEQLPRRVEANTHRLMDLVADAGVKATFFTLGWVAKRHPALVQRMVSEGHEVASHGSDHRRADHQTPDQFRADVRASKQLLEDLGGTAVVGYRAPTFSIGRRNPWGHAVLAEEGFRYSSSVYPISHDLYGEPNAPRTPFRPLPDFTEIPLTTLRLFGVTLPAAGGGYFRLAPYRLTKWAIDRAGRGNNVPCVFYVHPWEIDPDQPRQRQAPPLSRFRHYHNLCRTEFRLRRLLRDFNWGRIDQVFFGDGAPPHEMIASWLQ